jgi:uncharacterized protein (DUF58 family)
LLWSWRHVRKSLSKLDFQREVPPSVCAGEPLIVDLHAACGRRRGTSWAVVVEDTLRRESSGSKGESALNPRVLFARLGPREKQSQAYQGQLVERGRYQLGPLRVRTRFPLGLVRRTETVDAPAKLLVLPRRGRLTPRWHQRNHRASLGSRGVKHRHGLAEGDFHSLRDYRPGDTRSRIHWRTSARRGELMVQQFEEQRNQDLALVLDLWRPETPGPSARDAVELAVSFAATVVSDQCRRGGGQLLLGIAGDRSTLCGGRASIALLGNLLETLALTEANPTDRLSELLPQVLERMPRHGEILIVSTRGAGVEHATRLTADAYVNRSWALDARNDVLFDYFEPL